MCNAVFFYDLPPDSGVGIVGCAFEHDCGELDSHHILNWQEYPELRFDVNNGITLCQFHHPRGKNQEKEQSIYLKGLINKKMPC